VFFSGGGGLLLLMQPVKLVETKAIKKQFTNIFTFHSRGVREFQPQIFIRGAWDRAG
jgi:hypothetical protein